MRGLASQDLKIDMTSGDSDISCPIFLPSLAHFIKIVVKVKHDISVALVNWIRINWYIKYGMNNCF